MKGGLYLQSLGLGISGGLEFGLEPKLGLEIDFGAKIKIKWFTCDQMKVHDGI